VVALARLRLGRLVQEGLRHLSRDVADLVRYGWLSRTHWFFGVKWMEHAHEILANIMLALVILHVLGVIHASWRHRENLVLSMVTGRKRDGT